MFFCFNKEAAGWPVTRRHWVGTHAHVHKYTNTPIHTHTHWALDDAGDPFLVQGPGSRGGVLGGEGVLLWGPITGAEMHWGALRGGRGAHLPQLTGGGDATLGDGRWREVRMGDRGWDR